MRASQWLSRQRARDYKGFRVVRDADLHRVWEEQHLRRLLADLGVDCVLDIGANHGQYAEMLRNQVGYGGRIVSFEPIRTAASVIRVKSSNDPLWTVEELAICPTSGVHTFNIMACDEFSSLSRPRHDDVGLFRTRNEVLHSVDVATQTLDEVYGRLADEYGFFRPFLKLDTQGMDVEIVRSGASVMRNFVGMQSELSVRAVYESSVDYRRALSVYEELGFTLSAFVPNNAGHYPILVETDCIMIRSDLATFA